MKNKESLIIFAVSLFVLLGAFYLAYSRFADNQEAVAVKINRLTPAQMNSKALDLSILSDSRFAGLKKINFEPPPVNAINVGKSNPFAAAESGN